MLDFFKEFIFPIYSFLLIKYEDYEKEIQNKKKKIKKSFHKIISYLPFFIFLYYLKNFLFFLLSKFDKLLTNRI